MKKEEMYRLECIEDGIVACQKERQVIHWGNLPLMTADEPAWSNDRLRKAAWNILGSNHMF
jgi:hypothetical protein